MKTSKGKNLYSKICEQCI